MISWSCKPFSCKPVLHWKINKQIMINKDEFRKYAVKHRRISSIHVDKFISRVEDKLLPSNITPYIIEERQLNVAQMDVFSRLMMEIGRASCRERVCKYV